MGEALPRHPRPVPPGDSRILKRLEVVRTVEAILPNAHATCSVGVPSATVIHTLNADEDSIHWKNELGASPLTPTCVFDAPAVAGRAVQLLLVAMEAERAAAVPRAQAKPTSTRVAVRGDVNSEINPNSWRKPSLPRCAR